jgi:hypothetical protein
VVQYRSDDYVEVMLSDVINNNFNGNKINNFSKYYYSFGIKIKKNFITRPFPIIKMIDWIHFTGLCLIFDTTKTFTKNARIYIIIMYAFIHY